MKYISAATAIDGYKVSHKFQYPLKTTMAYANLTPRHSKHFKHKDFDGKIVNFGAQYISIFIKELWDDTFFTRDREAVLKNLESKLQGYSGHVGIEHFEELWRLGYLPIEIKALPEGTLVPLNIPLITIQNTDPRFYWLVNFLETMISCEMWHILTSATISRQYNKVLTKWSEKTCDSNDHIIWQGHDFSMRGHTSIHSAAKSGAGHLLWFLGTDTLPAIDFLDYYYGERVGHSISASEHSTMTANIQSRVPELSLRDAETETFRDLITRVYPSGLLALVSDSYNFWDTLTITLPQLKDIIMARDGKLVIRPDSGDPIDVICGDVPIVDNILEAAQYFKHTFVYTKDQGHGIYGDKGFQQLTTTREHRGAVEILWDIFGGTINDKGYKVLDSHIGLIYGDSITIDRADEICKRLEAKGFASSNIVFGIGSYTFQGTTRDTFGMAIKATAITCDGKLVEVYKDPVGDAGKKSAKGLLKVDLVDGEYKLFDQVSEQEEKEGCLRTIFKDGEFFNKETFSTIKARLS